METIDLIILSIAAITINLIAIYLRLGKLSNRLDKLEETNENKLPI